MADAPDAHPLLDPALAPADPGVRHWLAQVTLRLRREIAWAWHQRGADAAAPGTLPPFTDAAQDSLDLLRHRGDKLAFFNDDATARFLTDCLAALQRPETLEPQDRWDAIASVLQLDPASQFVMACALAARADASLGPVCAAALNDASRPHPTLALAQRLWDAPLDLVPCAEPTHILYRSGLLRPPGGSGTGGSGSAAGDWSAPLDMPAAVAQGLLSQPAGRTLPASLRPLPGAGLDLPPPALALAQWLRATPVQGMQVVPVQVLRGADTGAWVGTLAHHAGARLAALADDLTPTHPALPGLACAAWLHGADLLAPDHWAHYMQGSGGHDHAADWTAPLAGIAVRWWVPVHDAGALRAGAAAQVAPAFQVPALSVSERARRLREVARKTMEPPVLEAALDHATEAARRFRLQDRQLARIERILLREDGGWTNDDLLALAQAEAAVDMTQLAQPVAPRFTLRELVLPARWRAQLDAIVNAMRTLHKVHHDWGLGPAWNEGGLAVMFCGPPGTGKTMAAEALASELRLPMYRIDLSQVINKYIGETEKNLRRIFDAAEATDCLLFFDEADALFGKRTEVKDAHDRFANIEISYLLERMERFKGLAVLATNRRKDLDEAFVRRLRYIVEFPVPGVAERAAIWRQVFPAPVDARGIDFPFLAERFELAGGAIRSAAFNACGQAAVTAKEPKVDMADVLLAIKRELEKAGREVADEQFAHYAGLVTEAEARVERPPEGAAP